MDKEAEVMRVWDKFENKNVSFGEFRKRMLGIMKPPSMNDIGSKRTAIRNKREIDRAISRN